MMQGPQVLASAPMLNELMGVVSVPLDTKLLKLMALRLKIWMLTLEIRHLKG